MYMILLYLVIYVDFFNLIDWGFKKWLIYFECDLNVLYIINDNVINVFDILECRFREGYKVLVCVSIMDSVF